MPMLVLLVGFVIWLPCAVAVAPFAAFRRTQPWAFVVWRQLPELLHSLSDPN